MNNGKTTLADPGERVDRPFEQGRQIDSRVRIGHVHLKVADLERAITFYRDALGFEVTQRFADQAAFLSAGGYHHHIGLNTWRRERNWGGLCGGSCRRGYYWKGSQTMVSAKRSICAIRTKMAWNCTGTGHKNSGQERGMGG